ncbi:MAG TPA: (d)CMP kinase [Chloroflexota bacterium]|nr:(d)CMP kinase [Chloroflexota bacterium]
MSGTSFVIALDGPAASGKSTVGLGVASRLGLRYFDTGLLYRALSWLALQRHIELTDAAALVRLIDDLDVEVDALGNVLRSGRDITPSLHRPEVDLSVSTVAAHAAVRQALVPVQRSLVRQPGIVMAGRDIGTVIVPEAALKIWLNASAEERARRRSQQSGEDYREVLVGMRRRDQLDASRTVAPMTRATDAIVVETDRLAAEQVIERIVELAQQRGLQAEQRV